MVDLISHRFRMLGEPFRIRLLQQLRVGERTVNELVAGLDAKQPNVSKHLGMLYDAGLVSRRRDGNSIVYAICDPMVFRLCDLVCQSATERSKREFEELTGQTVAKNKRR